MEDYYYDSLYQLLKEVQLEHFYPMIKSIDVTKIEHFENVLFTDLIGPQVGMGAPAARRLLEAARKRNNNKWKKNFFNIILPMNVKSRERGSSVPISSERLSNGKTNHQEDSNETGGLTCLIPNSDIKLLDKIGDGSFGVVMKAQWTQPNKSIKFVAVKVLKQEVLSRALDDFAKEVNAMHQLRNENLIKLYGIVLSSPMMMVTELAEQGSLRAKLVKTQGKLSLSTLVNYSGQIATGLDYLESKRLIHRDLATRNIFITGQDIIKIGDFGLMRSVPCDEDYYTMSDNMKVPFPWCAIESLKYRQFSHAKPWAGLNGSQIIRKIEKNERLPIPNSSSQRIYKVMNLCWKIEPKERPTFTALSEFFKSSQPIKLKAAIDFDNCVKIKSKNLDTEKSFLKLFRDDEIEVIEGKSENYWWRGQNQRTFEIGLFPRSISKDLKNFNSNDISKPLKNSFIHTGHMDPLGKKTWGNPEYIEKMYLEHPIEPEDMLSFESGDDSNVLLENRSGKKEVPAINEDKIEKIISIDEIVKSKNNGECDEKNLKEEFLIDFDSVQSFEEQDESKTSTIKDEKDPIVVEMKTEDILALYNQNNILDSDVLGLEKNQSSIDEILGSNELKKKVSSPIKISSQPSIPTPSIPSTSDLNEPKNYHSKYYIPPLDNYQSSSTLLSKNRYYSSVCSNFDQSFKNEPQQTAPSSFPSATNTQLCEPSCQCCQWNMSCSHSFYPTITSSWLNNGFYNDDCSSLMMSNHHDCQIDSCHNVNELQPSSPSSPLSPKVKNSFEGNNSFEKKSEFQTKICKDFIKELEANFSKVTATKSMISPGINTSATIYPTINPPPKSTKVRRPAPPPPIQKKN
ncbi:Ack-like kinase domain protein [Sarcoptes scabiei]|uniref:non-specific protein-tyrosine kinase n=1 Tax=Sarcoptes scabiei TaxID=52283 RepID=A0A132A5C5_SARSC|nr:Ack-like kinase domain protein [Sarcoptes scabiei]